MVWKVSLKRVEECFWSRGRIAFKVIEKYGNCRLEYFKRGGFVEKDYWKFVLRICDVLMVD